MKCETRIQFFHICDVLEKTISNEIFFEGYKQNTIENERSRIMRNGITVMAFSTMENFLNTRVNEEIKLLKNSNFSFDDFEEDLQKFILVDSVLGLSNKINLSDNNEKLNCAEEGIREISGYREHSPTFSGLGFSPKGSNVNFQDIETLFKRIGVSKISDKLKFISTDIGFTQIGIKDQFFSFKRARNKCAHDSLFNIPYNDLEQYLIFLRIFCIIFDILLSYCISLYLFEKSHASLKDRMDNFSINYRFIEHANGRWKERKAWAKKATKIYESEKEAISNAKNRKGNFFLIVRETDQNPKKLI